MSRTARKAFWRIGEPCVWLASAAITAVMAMVLILAGVIAVNAVSHLWPPRMELVEQATGSAFLGVVMKREPSPGGGNRSQYKVANRELNNGADFRWIPDSRITSSSLPPDAALVERLSGGDLYAFLEQAIIGGRKIPIPAGDAALKTLGDSSLGWRRRLHPLQEEIFDLAEALHAGGLRELRLVYDMGRTVDGEAKTRLEGELAGLRAANANLKSLSGEKMEKLSILKGESTEDVFIFRTAEGDEVRLPILEIVRLDWPNRMGLWEQACFFGARIATIVTEHPREANTEGGLLPSIFGTVILVFLMSISAFPLGVVAGIYLREYARDGAAVRMVRIAVNNLAGIPSIVYGIFGLGFFVYGAGSALDRLLYPERAAAGITTFGTGGVLWAALTLGILTLPVVIVSTEEALGAIPSEIRQGSMALGATRLQTLCRVLLPMAVPGILTGFILAMSRAAGEVAPLMITGVVKSAPSLPLDGNFPFLHLERKFMHLGFHIYDIGFQSPNVEASKPMVYVTAMLLLFIVFLLNITAVRLRNRMRRKYAGGSF